MEIICSHDRIIFPLRIDLIFLESREEITNVVPLCLTDGNTWRCTHLRTENTVAIIRRRYTVYNIITCVSC